MLVILLIHDLELTERHVTYRNIKEAIGKVRLFVPVNGYSVFLIELPCNSTRKAVKLYAVDLALAHTVGEHTHKVARTAGGFKDIAALQAHLFKSFIHCSDYDGRSVERGQR